MIIFIPEILGLPEKNGCMGITVKINGRKYFDPLQPFAFVSRHFINLAEILFRVNAVNCVKFPKVH